MEWLARRFLLTLENTINFSKDKVHDTIKTNKYSRLVWNVVSPQLKTEYYNYIDLSKLELTDRIFSIGFETDIHYLFDASAGTFRLWDFPGDVHTAITYELNRDLRTIKRKVYGVLDFLGDVGGLAAALMGLFKLGIRIFQYKTTINYVGNFLYLIRDGDELKYKKNLA